MSAEPEVPKKTFLSVATDTLKLVVGMAASPGGLALATQLLGPVSPAILLVEQFGVRILGPMIATWTAASISEDDVTANLATRGFKTTPYDPMAAFG